MAALRSAVRSPSLRSAASKLTGATKRATASSPSPSRPAFRSPLFSRVFRCPAELSAASLQPFHTATASALMTSMLTVPRCFGYVTIDDH